jgi:LuxR family transcriptional regulator, maltose regulon positive regulatory protein
VTQATITRGDPRTARFAWAKFRPPALPATLVTRTALLDRLTDGAGLRLTVTVGSAGAGKSVLLSSWAAARPPGLTCWLSCDCADADPVRFWTGFIEAIRVAAPEFGADAAQLLAMDRAMSADVTASIANDAAKLPAGSAIVVDDFHHAAPAAGRDMSDLVDCWPAENAQLVLASRADPPLRLHRLRISGELCELRDRDLRFSLSESRDLLASYGVRVDPDDLSLLHRRSEGWVAALQMAALSLRGGGDPARAAQALDIGSGGIAEYFISEVLDQQSPEMARFMLDTSILGELTAAACAAVTGRQDATGLLRRIDAANLFVVALDDERDSFRYHHLVRLVLRAELRARDRSREQALQLRAAEWFESAGNARRAARHFLAAGQVSQALALLQDRVVPDFLRDPALPPPLDLGALRPALLAEVPEQLLGLAGDLLMWGDMPRGGDYLDLLERARPSIPHDSKMAARLAALRCFQYGQTGRLNEAVEAACDARAVQERLARNDEWNAAVPLVLLDVYSCLEDFEAVEREAATALAMPDLPEAARLVLVPGGLALSRWEAGRLTEAADAAQAAAAAAQRLGFEQHYFAVDCLRTLAGLALERRDLVTAERLAEQALSIGERRRPVLEFLVLLDRAGIWAVAGQIREALATVEAARRVLPRAAPALLGRADELEARLRLSLGDLHSARELARRLPAARRELLLSMAALAAGDDLSALEHLHSASALDLTPRRALEHQILLAATAIERGDPGTAGMLAGVLETGRRDGYLNTIVSTAPAVTSWLVEHATQMRADPFLEQLIVAALEARAWQPDDSRPGGRVVEPLTGAEQRILKLLPTSTYLQIADALSISRNTVKSQLRSIYQKLGATSRAQAIERAVDLRLL